MDDEIELTDDQCPKCGNTMATRPCIAACEDGYENRYEEDPLWYDEDEWFVCDECRGHGFHVWCQKCGWDALEKRFPNGAPAVELPNVENQNAQSYETGAATPNDRSSATLGGSA